MSGLLTRILATRRHPAVRSRWDVVVVVVVLLGAVLGDAGPLATVAIAVTLAVVVWFRKTLPFVACMVGLGVALLASQTVDSGQSTYVVGILVLVYGLSRWASGRNIACGAVVIAAVGSLISPLNASVDGAQPLVARILLAGAEAAIECSVWVVPFVVGLVVRYRASAHAADVTAARSNERSAFARELHDTVAHHVSAIAIQAQAGQAVAGSRPEAAIQALAEIEVQARQTLDEMRQMVRALREADDETELEPQASIGNIAALADTRSVPTVSVDIVGELQHLSPSVQASLFRIAQEAITNARRHARDATWIRVTLHADVEDVHLLVEDDGRKVPTKDRPAGFGLVGMAERAALLDGHFLAGPGETGGWKVEATLPRTGAAL